MVPWKPIHVLQSSTQGINKEHSKNKKNGSHSIVVQLSNRSFKIHYFASLNISQLVIHRLFQAKFSWLVRRALVRRLNASNKTLIACTVSSSPFFSISSSSCSSLSEALRRVPESARPDILPDLSSSQLLLRQKSAYTQWKRMSDQGVCVQVQMYHVSNSVKWFCFQPLILLMRHALPRLY